MSYTDCEIPSFYSLSEPVAAKAHHCCECSAPIASGEKYVKCVGVWAGEFSTWRQHQLCSQACELVRDGINSGDCIPFGSLLEWWSGERCHLPKDRFGVPELRALLAKIVRRERLGK